jgi:ketosteroid isomerase-like protein
MTTLLETPWPAMIWGSLIALVLLVVALKTGHGMWLIVMAGVLVITAGLVILERIVVSERERVEQTLYDCAAAVETNNVAAVLGFVSEHAGSARSRIRAELPHYTIGNVSISGLEIKLIGDPATTATADLIGHCWVDERRGGSGQRMTVTQRFLVRLQKENGRWVLTDYEHRPLLGE